MGVDVLKCETWSPTLREEHRWRMFGPEKEKVAESWRILHNKELHYLYSSPSIIRVIK
jgi:hypothetical protein